MNKDIPIVNAIFSRADARDYQFIASSITLPSRVDLRKTTANIKDQAQAGACTGFAATSCAEAITPELETLSPQFAYTTTKIAENRPGQSGTYAIRDVLETARKLGWPLETEWPYSGTEADITPPADVYASAATRKVERYERIPLGLAALSTDVALGVANIKNALAQGMPVMIALAVGYDLLNQNKPLAQQNYGPIHIPGWNYYTNEYYGAHAVVIVGYDDALGGFIIQNSWGKQYGDGGYFLLQYQCLQDFAEAWVIREFAGQSFQDPVEYAIRKGLVALYVLLLDRSPDNGGFKFWADIAVAGHPLNALAVSLATSIEGRSKYPTDGDLYFSLIDPVKRARFENRVKVAEYCTLDIACDKVEVFGHALDNVTEDPASIDAAKYWIRTHMNGGGGML